MLTINQILQQGRYRIINQLGQNGIGMGYEAYDNVLEANVLLKEIRDNLGKVTTAAQLETNKLAFTDQAKRLSEIKHESLSHVQNFFSEVDRHYLVTEYIDGNTLGELLEKNNSSFPLTDVGNWADRLLDGINYLHTQNPPVIHGEIKPSNVRLETNGKVKLMVFNIIKGADEKAETIGSNQTFDAAVLPYLPLEQIWDGLDAASQKVILTNYDEKSERILEQPLDTRSDLYALAATLYHLLTARIPADSLTRSIDILEGKSDPLQSPSKLNPAVPTEISNVLMKALEIKRENRFSSAVIMRQVLRTAFVRVKEREATEVKPAKPVEPQQAKPAEIKPIKREDDAVLEIPLVEQKPSELQTAPVVPPKNPEIEGEQARQLELIKQQLRKAEEQRLEAERRAAEAEKRLLEKEAEKPIAVEPATIKAEAEKPLIAKPAVIKPEPVQKFTPEPPAEVIPEPRKEVFAPEHTTDDFSGMFAEARKESNAFKKVAAAAVAFVVLGGAGFGIWSFTKTKSPETAPAMTSTNAAIPAPSVETAPAPTDETAPVSSYQATSDTTTQPPTSTEVKTETSNPTAIKKAATTPTPAQAKKPTATPVKTAETQKKVTLDDLLKDN